MLEALEIRTSQEPFTSCFHFTSYHALLTFWSRYILYIIIIIIALLYSFLKITITHSSIPVLTFNIYCLLSIWSFLTCIYFKIDCFFNTCVFHLIFPTSILEISNFQVFLFCFIFVICLVEI